MSEQATVNTEEKKVNLEELASEHPELQQQIDAVIGKRVAKELEKERRKLKASPDDAQAYRQLEQEKDALEGQLEELQAANKTLTREKERVEKERAKFADESATVRRLRDTDKATEWVLRKLNENKVTPDAVDAIADAMLGRTPKVDYELDGLTVRDVTFGDKSFDDVFAKYKKDSFLLSTSQTGHGTKSGVQPPKNPNNPADTGAKIAEMKKSGSWDQLTFDAKKQLMDEYHGVKAPSAK